MTGGLEQTVSILKELTRPTDQTGWMCDEVAFLLYALVKFQRPQLVIQTGHHWGKSAAVVCEALSDGFLDSGQLIESDPMRGDAKFTAYLQAHAPARGPWRMVSVDPGPPVADSDAGVRYLTERYRGCFQFVQAKSADFFLSAMWEELVAGAGGCRALAVVDGDHAEDVARADLEAVDRLRPLIFLDDTSWAPHLAEVAAAFAAERKYATIELPLYNGVTVLMPS
jgi:hypothetical protein